MVNLVESNPESCCQSKSLIDWLTIAKASNELSVEAGSHHEKAYIFQTCQLRKHKLETEPQRLDHSVLPQLRQIEPEAVRHLVVSAVAFFLHAFTKGFFEILTQNI